MKLAAFILLATVSSSANASDACSRVPDVANFLVTERAAGIMKGSALDRFNAEIKSDPAKLSLYRKVADLAYQYPFRDANRVSDMALRECYQQRHDQ